MSECEADRHAREMCEPCELCGTPVHLSCGAWFHIVEVQHTDGHRPRRVGGGIVLAGCGILSMPHTPDFCRTIRSFRADPPRLTTEITVTDEAYVFQRQYLDEVIGGQDADG